MTIAAVSDLLGIPVPTIRSWEHRYGFPDPARTEGKHRRYAPEHVEQLRAIRIAITTGFPSSQAVALARRGGEPASVRDPSIDILLRAAIDLDHTAARSLLEEIAERRGVEDTIADVVLPAMHDVGERWKAGTCGVAGEHVLTDVVRRWFARMTALASAPADPRERVAILACGPQELHSVGLEAFGVLLVRRGWSTVVLGQMTPAGSLLDTVRRARARAAVVVAQRSVNRRSTAAALASIHPALGARTFYAGEAFATAASRRDVAGTYLGTDLLRAAGLVEEGSGFMREVGASASPAP